jgi:uncharacterized protein YhaN
VRIDRIHIDGFGRLHDFDTGPAGLPGLVTVFGPNEAGKSTLFTFLTTALYGFQPATRERNPHVPWGADEAAGRVRLRLQAGGCVEVERRLRSQPTGRLALDGVATELRNQPLPWVEHVPRTVFRQVFAVTLADLAGLDSETWARIQDKVVGTMGATDLRSARSVAETLEREAGEIWRPSRRGNQRVRDLQAEGRVLRGRRAAAFERDTRVRALVEEAEQVHARLREAREQRQRDRLSLERAQTLLPVRQQLDRIASLRRQGEGRGALSGLPADPPARLAELEAERARACHRRQALDRELGERETEMAAFDDAARKLLSRREDVVRLVARAAASAADRSRAAELESEIRGSEGELDSVSRTVLERSWRDVPPADLDSVPIELLRDRVARARLAAMPVGRTAASPRAAPTAAALAVGLALLAWGGANGSLMAAAGGAALSAIALTLLVASKRGRTAPSAPGAASTGEAARAEVRSVLSGLPVRADHLERPGEQLVGSLSRLQLLIRERAQRAHAWEAARDRVAEVDTEASSLARALGVDALATAEATAHALDLGARGAEGLQHAAVAAEREARRLGAEVHALTGVTEALDRELALLSAAGEAIVGGDPEAGLREALVRLQAHRRADELRDELERAHPDLAEIERQIVAAEGARAAWMLDDEQLVTIRTRLERLEDDIEQLVKRSEALARDAEHLRELETVDSVDSELEALRELEARLVRERDRRWVLAKLLREADRRFREEHQPDLLRRAGSYLRHLTGGRYERLVVDERGDKNLFQVVGPGLPVPVPLAPPVSTGTLEQAYLSLRLAIVDHLDQSGERLPLFVDEVLVNWDRERRSRGLDVLAGISADRQVFVFTCHEGLTAELQARGAMTLRLGGC